MKKFICKLRLIYKSKYKFQGSSLRDVFCLIFCLFERERLITESKLSRSDFMKNLSSSGNGRRDHRTQAAPGSPETHLGASPFFPAGAPREHHKGPITSHSLISSDSSHPQAPSPGKGLNSSAPPASSSSTLSYLEFSSPSN